jgi:D-alanyl-D-alanine carboxypeptidase
MHYTLSLDRMSPMKNVLKLRTSLLGMSCFLLVSFWSGALPAAESPSQSLEQKEQMRQRIDAYLTAESANTDGRYLQKGAFSGVVLVAADGEVVFSKSFGYANREWDIPATTDTKFRLWSITKVFTAVGILRLQEQGRLRLDDSIEKYLENCPRAWRAITVRHLLAHTSGLREGLAIYGPNEFGVAGESSANRYRTRVTSAQMLELSRNKPLDFAPGSNFSYNNFGYYIAGLVIEKVIGKSYEDALNELIFSPLGMNNTGLDRPEQILPKRAAYYQDKPPSATTPNSKQILQNAEFFDVPSWIFSAGGLYSTTEDLLKFDRALSSGSLLTSATMKEMWTPASASGHYGLGWELDNIAERRCFSHVGAGGGASMRFMHFPDERITIIILTNTPGMGAVFTQLADVVFDNYPNPSKN